MMPWRSAASSLRRTLASLAKSGRFSSAAMRSGTCSCCMNAAYCAKGMQKPSGTLARGARADFSAPRLAAFTPQWRLSRVAMPVSGLSALTVRSGLGSGRPAALGGGVAGASGLATGRT
ncbi:hypothetical protein G6F68_020034 [Rhizopus microsporus]|nr:hypothetical protein G6F68_020034 [Rhizopus microsporus]